MDALYMPLFGREVLRVTMGPCLCDPNCGGYELRYQYAARDADLARALEQELAHQSWAEVQAVLDAMTDRPPGRD